SVLEDTRRTKDLVRPILLGRADRQHPSTELCVIVGNRNGNMMCVFVPTHSLCRFTGRSLAPVLHDVFVAHWIVSEPLTMTGGRHNCPAYESIGHSLFA